MTPAGRELVYWQPHVTSECSAIIAGCIVMGNASLVAAERIASAIDAGAWTVTGAKAGAPAGGNNGHNASRMFFHLESGKLGSNAHASRSPVKSHGGIVIECMVACSSSTWNSPSGIAAPAPTGTK